MPVTISQITTPRLYTSALADTECICPLQCKDSLQMACWGKGTQQHACLFNSPQHFRGGPLQRAYHTDLGEDGTLHEPGQAYISHLGRVVFCEEDVGRLEVELRASTRVNL